MLPASAAASLCCAQQVQVCKAGASFLPSFMILHMQATHLLWDLVPFSNDECLHMHCDCLLLSCAHFAQAALPSWTETDEAHLRS